MLLIYSLVFILSLFIQIILLWLIVFVKVHVSLLAFRLYLVRN